MDNNITNGQPYAAPSVNPVPAQTAETVVPPEPVPQMPGPPPPSGSSFLFSFWFWGPLIFLLNFVTIFWFLIYPRLGNLIEISNQSSLNQEIQIDRLVIKERAALVIVRSSPDSLVGSILGETGIFLPGTYEDFSVPTRIVNDVTGELVRITPGFARAILFRDLDNSGSFNSEFDTEPVKDLFGNSIMIEFVFQ